MQDLRSAFRNLARSPGLTVFTFVAPVLGGLRAAEPRPDAAVVGLVPAAHGAFADASSGFGTDAFIAGGVDSLPKPQP